MGFIGTALAVGVGTRGAAKRGEHVARMNGYKRNAELRTMRAPFVAWLDSLDDGAHYVYAATILGMSKGSRYADRLALIAMADANAF